MVRFRRWTGRRRYVSAPGLDVAAIASGRGPGASVFARLAGSGRRSGFGLDGAAIASGRGPGAGVSARLADSGRRGGGFGLRGVRAPARRSRRVRTRRVRCFNVAGNGARAFTAAAPAASAASAAIPSPGGTGSALSARCGRILGRGNVVLACRRLCFGGGRGARSATPATLTMAGMALAAARCAAAAPGLDAVPSAASRRVAPGAMTAGT